MQPKNKKEGTERKTHASAHLVQHMFKMREGSPEGIRKTMEERICDMSLTSQAKLDYITISASPCISITDKFCKLQWPAYKSQ